MNIDQTSTANARPVRRRSAKAMGDFKESKAAPGVVDICIDLDRYREFKGDRELKECKMDRRLGLGRKSLG